MRIKDSFTCIIFALCLVNGMCKADNDLAEKERKGFDIFCGPRCAELIIRHYFRKAPALIDIIKQIQWPDAHSGVDIGALNNYLKENNVKTNLVVFPKKKLPLNRNPCIAHLNPEPGKEVGHFIVIFPCDSIWISKVFDSGGIKLVPSWELEKKFSGHFIFTGEDSQAYPKQVIFLGDDIIFLLAVIVLFTLNFFVFCRSNVFWIHLGITSFFIIALRLYF